MYLYLVYLIMNNKKNVKRKLEDKSWEEVFNSVPKYKRKAILEKMGIDENLDPSSGESIIKKNNPQILRKYKLTLYQMQHKKL